MRNECLNSRWGWNKPLPVSRLVSMIGTSILFLLKSLLISSICTFDDGVHVYFFLQRLNFYQIILLNTEYFFLRSSTLSLNSIYFLFRHIYYKLAASPRRRGLTVASRLWLCMINKKRIFNKTG